MRGYGRMHGYRGKITGLVIAGLGMTVWLIHHYTHFAFTDKLDGEQHSLLFWWTTLFGLYLVAFSREKNDDERVKSVRAKSMLAGFNLSMAALLSFSITAWLAKDFVIDAGTIMILPTFCLLFYLLLFHIGIYFDNVWDYSDNDEGIFKTRHNKKQLSYIIYLAIIAILVGLAIYETIMKLR